MQRDGALSFAREDVPCNLTCPPAVSLWHHGGSRLAEPALTKRSAIEEGLKPNMYCPRPLRMNVVDALC